MDILNDEKSEDPFLSDEDKYILQTNKSKFNTTNPNIVKKKRKE